MAGGIGSFGPTGVPGGGVGPSGMGSAGMPSIQESSSVDQFQREMGQQGYQQQGINDQALQNFFGNKATANDPDLLDQVAGALKDVQSHYATTTEKLKQPKPIGVGDTVYQMQMMWDMNQMSLHTQLVTKIASKVSSAAQKLMSGQ